MVSAVAAVAAAAMEQANTGLGCYMSCYSLRRKQGLLIGKGGVCFLVGTVMGGVRVRVRVQYKSTLVPRWPATPGAWTQIKQVVFEREVLRVRHFISRILMNFMQRYVLLTHISFKMLCDSHHKRKSGIKEPLRVAKNVPTTFSHLDCCRPDHRAALQLSHP